MDKKKEIFKDSCQYTKKHDTMYEKKIEKNEKTNSSDGEEELHEII